MFPIRILLSAFLCKYLQTFAIHTDSIRLVPAFGWSACVSRIRKALTIPVELHVVVCVVWLLDSASA